MRRVDLANWTLRTSPKFTIRVKYQFHQGFDQIRDSKIPVTLLPHKKYIILWNSKLSLHLHIGAPTIFSDLLRSVQMLKREWGAENNGQLRHLFIPSKTATLVPEFAVKDLPLSRTAALVPELAIKYLPLGRKLWWLLWYINFQSLGKQAERQNFQKRES